MIKIFNKHTSFKWKIIRDGLSPLPYSILYCYDECSNSLDDTHNYYKCLCKNEFKEGNNSNDESSFNDIRQSIKNHYEKTINPVEEQSN